MCLWLIMLGRQIYIQQKHYILSRVDVRLRWLLKFNTLRMGSFKLFKRPFPGFLTILTL